ncbi:hypothetical protein KP509_13G017700 [Ceratopteris richardii]|uniref:Uncharacterized protein n=1 Tax=Ceratopteris richardii TaxID=49495 RepID=A0A8T2TDP6_CERRI|nr:hypothetical protein KP509_13G017700 [Ceratopteris richardii]
MDEKRSRASNIPLGAVRGSTCTLKSDIDGHNRNLKINASSPENYQERKNGVTHHVRSFSCDRNKLLNVSEVVTKEGTKMGGKADSPGHGWSNQNGGLYVGSGKVGGTNGVPQDMMNKSMLANGKEDNFESASCRVHARSNSVGSITTGKSPGSQQWTFKKGSEDVSEKPCNVGSLNNGNPAQDSRKASKVCIENGSGRNKSRGLGNIGGMGGSLSAKSSPSARNLATGNASVTGNSGEFKFPASGSFVGYRDNSTPCHTSELNGYNAEASSSSSSSSPHTSGEVGASKVHVRSRSKSSPDAFNNSFSSGLPQIAPTEGDISGRRVSLSANAGKGTKVGALSSPPRNGGASNDSNLGNLGNILNPSRTSSCLNGNILSAGLANNGIKGSDNYVNIRNGVSDIKLETVDSMNDATLIKKGLFSCNAEEVKNYGNELYRKGNFADALCLYERAITLSPAQACYRSNKAAALSGLGHLPQAVHECEEAIKLDPLYVRAHQRAGSLYLRAKHHFQSAGQWNSAVQELQQVEQVKMHISKCIEMRKAAHWKSVLRESDAAIVSGADSAPQVMGYKAEALLKLGKFSEADGVLSAAQRIEEALTKLGITPADSFLYLIRAYLDMALGRFEEAVAAAQSAVRIDPRKLEAMHTLKKAHAVCLTRSQGNELFKMGKFFEACVAYSEGLESDPMNAVLLCNRAACRSKIGQWEKAIEDCDAALKLQPNYTKALMRRADCNAKLERWEDALNDYEDLLQKLPGDQDIAQGIAEAQSALKRTRGETM